MAFFTVVGQIVVGIAVGLAIPKTVDVVVETTKKAKDKVVKVFQKKGE